MIYIVYIMILYDQAVYKCERKEKISLLIIVSYGLNVKHAETAANGFLVSIAVHININIL